MCVADEKHDYLTCSRNKLQVYEKMQEYDLYCMPKVQSCKLSYDQHLQLNIDPEIKQMDKPTLLMVM